MKFEDLKKDNIRSIQLINTDLSEVRFEKQFSKVEDKLEDLEESLEGQDKERIMGNFFDLLQEGIGLLTFYGISAKRLMNYYPTHLDKVKENE